MINTHDQPAVFSHTDAYGIILTLEDLTALYFNDQRKSAAVMQLCFLVDL